MGTVSPNIQTELLLFQCVPVVCHLPTVYLGKDPSSVVLLTYVLLGLPSHLQADQAQLPQPFHRVLWPLSIWVASAEPASDG